MSKVYFVTFGCDNRFKQSRQRLAKEAEATGWFEDIFVYEPKLLTSYQKSFEGRGAGYWWWKSVIQYLAMQQINEGDFLLYLDAGGYINKHGESLFKQYIEKVSNNSGFLAWSTDSIEKNWTKRDLFKLLECDNPEFTESKQIGCGLVIYRKSEWTVSFIDEFVKLSSIQHFINDDSSYHPNYENFMEHRHDQSVFSLLTKKYSKVHDIALINDYIGSHNDSLGPAYLKEVEYVKEWFLCNSSKPRIRKSNTLTTELTFPFLHCRLDDSKFTWV